MPRTLCVHTFILLAHVTDAMLETTSTGQNLRANCPHLTSTDGVREDGLLDEAAVTAVILLFSSRPVFLLQVAGGGTGFLRLWFAAPEGVGAKKEAFLFVNDSEGQNEECLLICMRGVCP